MKRLMTTTLVALSLVTCAHADAIQERARAISTSYNQGLIHMRAGQIEKARTSLKRVLELEPGHGHATYQLARLDTVGKNFLLKARKTKFKTTKLSEVDFHDATLSEVAEALNVMAKETTDKKWSPNLLIQDSKGLIKNKKITLQMKNVPIAAVLKYVTEMVGATVQYDEYATLIRPR